MSIILDALKKSEAERQQSGAPGLYETKLAPPRQRLPLWLLIVCALLLVNALGLVWVLMRGHGGVTPPPATALPAPAPSPAASPVAAPAPVFNPPPTAPVATSPAPADTPPADAGPAVARNATAATDADSDEDDTPAVPASRTAGQAPAAAPTESGGSADNGGSHVYRVTPSDQAPPPGPPPPRSSVPNYQEAAVSAGLPPNLAINLHSWSKQPAQRYILLNMVRLREGDTSPQGVKVETITQDGAILSWQGREFSLQR